MKKLLATIALITPPSYSNSFVQGEVGFFKPPSPFEEGSLFGAFITKARIEPIINSDKP